MLSLTCIYFVGEKRSFGKTNVHSLQWSSPHWTWGRLEHWWRCNHAVQAPTPPATTSPQPQGFTPVIDWFTTFPFQESLSGLSTQLTFPRTLPIPIFMFLDSWPIFPVCNRDLEASSFKGNVSVKEDSFYPDKETYKILICSTKGLFLLDLAFLCALSIFCDKEYTEIIYTPLIPFMLHILF